MNQNKIWLAAPLVAVLVLSGCASTGSLALKQENTTTLQQKIIKGKTTKQQITQMFGEPQSRSVDDEGNETWEYTYTNTQSNAVNYVPYVNLLFSGAKTKTRVMEITFYKTDVVKSYSMSESQDQVRTGLLNQ